LGVFSSNLKNLPSPKSRLCFHGLRDVVLMLAMCAIGVCLVRSEINACSNPAALFGEDHRGQESR